MTDTKRSRILDSDVYPSKVNEPLADSAMLAHGWAKTHCRDCGSYHGAWQVLRLLGVFNSIRSDDDFILPRLDDEISRGAAKILVSGAADYAFLARIDAVARNRGVTPLVTVLDRCGTPLELNRWYAARSGLEVELVRSEVLDFRMPGAFDVICTHSFLCFLDEAGREQLAKIWWDCLAPGGAVITAQRTRPGNPSRLHGFPASRVRELGQRAFELAEAQFDRLGIDPEEARSLAVSYAVGRSSYTIRHSEHLRRLFHRQGFELEYFSPPGSGQAEPDTPSTPASSQDHRWRILARKPSN